MVESFMIMAGMMGGMSSHTRIRASSSAVLFVTLFVPYTAGRGCIRESIGMVSRCIQFLNGFGLLIVVMVTLANTYDFVWC